MRRFRTSAAAVSALLALAVIVPASAANADTTVIQNNVPECTANLTEPTLDGETMSLTGTVTCAEGYGGWGWLWFDTDGRTPIPRDGVGIIEFERPSQIAQLTVVAPCASGKYRTHLIISLGTTSGSGNLGYNEAVTDPVTITC
ncbi:hypothetical protein ACFHYQ_12180 [Sphaerimonospora cavernae]|uniref:Ig-like domain-containing protein n=1 Tax=Sphaerimonospora cavernae TaxID=1740611 RepID=A0ABV6U7F4_9ACTN